MSTVEVPSGFIWPPLINGKVDAISSLLLKTMTTGPINLLSWFMAGKTGNVKSVECLVQASSAPSELSVLLENETQATSETGTLSLIDTNKTYAEVVLSSVLAVTRGDVLKLTLGTNDNNIDAWSVNVPQTFPRTSDSTKPLLSLVYDDESRPVIFGVLPISDITTTHDFSAIEALGNSILHPFNSARIAGFYVMADIPVLDSFNVVLRTATGTVLDEVTVDSPDTDFPIGGGGANIVQPLGFFFKSFVVRHDLPRNTPVYLYVVKDSGNVEMPLYSMATPDLMNFFPAGKDVKGLLNSSGAFQVLPTQRAAMGLILDRLES